MSNSNIDKNAKLINAAKNGNAGNVRSLIREGADVNTQNDVNRTPLGC